MRRRTPALVVIAALVLAMLLVDRDPPARTEVAFGRPAALLPTADPAEALSSSWFCAAGASVLEAGIDTAVIIANAGAEDRSGTVAWATGPGPEQRTIVEVEVPALGSVEVAASEAVSGEEVSAVVELDGGEVAVEHRITDGPRSATAPCASSASTTWYLANGSTERDATQQLVLFNPFPDDAVVDITLATDQGSAEPAALQGLPVVAGATEVIELGDVVRRRVVTATTVQARSGRLVVDRVQRFDGSEGRAALALMLAAPTPATTWAFPEGHHRADLVERWHVYNPGADEALVTLELVPDSEEEPEPVDLTVPPRSQVTVEAVELGRLQPGSPHSSTVRATNGVPVVVERSLEASPPAAVTGWTSALGAPADAARWLVPHGGSTGELDEWLMVLNTGDEPVELSIVALVGEVLPVGLDEIEVAPGQRLVARLSSAVARTPLPLLVEASGPVVVERVLYRTAPGAQDLSSVMAVPMAPPA